MDVVHDSKFVVYVRLDRGHAATPDSLEKPVGSCHSYAEARQIQRQFRRFHRDCIIRFEGITGGGD